MDLTLVPLDQGIRLLPTSILGLLWLQTHFGKRHWEQLAGGITRIDRVSADQLLQDAERGGLRVAVLPALRSSTRP